MKHIIEKLPRSKGKRVIARPTGMSKKTSNTQFKKSQVSILMQHNGTINISA